MWTLECDTNILANKRIWLRPGKKYLFGRTLDPKGRNSSFQLKDEKSVSRQHLTLTVSNVKPGDGSLVHTRSEITLKDEATKFGTVVDGDKIKGDTRVLRKDEHIFQLGNSKHVFRVKWHPVVFSFSLSSKEMKPGKDPLASYRTRLEDLDIKVILPYVIGATTHVVSTKRNTAKGLQALINAKHIVAESYIDALVYATTPENLDELESLSPLEADFDNNWPNALEHLPAKSKEPNERPSEYFVPKPERSNVFDGYTFIFCDPTQFETLQAPITNGGGKALEYTLSPGKTTTEEIVRYVKNVAGEKGLGEFEDGSEGKGVVVVRFRGKKEFAEWAANLDTEVSLALGQRLIEQSEFMDAILMNDASMLRRPLLTEDEGCSQLNRSAAAANPRGAVAPSEHTIRTDHPAETAVSKPPSKRARTRGPIVSRFKGFDDDDVSVAQTFSQPGPAESQPDSVPGTRRSQRYTNGTSYTDSAMDVDSHVRESGTTENRNSRKRAAPASDEEDGEDQIDKLLPAAAAMKRRRIEDAEEAERNHISSERSFKASQKKAGSEELRKPKQEVNIREVVRERREAEEEAAIRDEENLRDALDGMNVEDMKKLIVVEDMEVPERAKKNQQKVPNMENNNRWDERWNGRKNFKKFRRPGEGAPVRRGQSVIVPLEEVKTKDYGIGQPYWEESEKTRKKHKEKDRSTQSQSQSQALYATAKSEPVEVPSELAIDGELPEVIDLEARRITRGQERTEQVDESSNRSQTVNGKRPASSLENGPTAKKQKRFAVQDSDSDSEDELKFRFKKKGR
ncbi:hypothetical protein JMJ35_001263 [Cladonia borealis]|uniref:FHA domain-containing protein n=1 Tax=Cladonia borealis TaxID=184061 RepID=A0AA39V9W0_9LECA|nr:hypothetical protein JMJ35_001263 [Cladonia borealis]